MKLFVFDYLECVSGSYHSEGGFVIIAKDKNEVLQMLSNVEELKYVDIDNEEWGNVEVFEMPEKTPRKYWIFPDAGCC